MSNFAALLTNRINIADYDYDLPGERIAQYPVKERDASKLLVYRNGVVSEDVFRNIDDYIQQGSLLVFNNSKVIKARLLFGKDTGAIIEVLCLEPLSPSGYETSLGSEKPVEWKCMVGNLRKWKRGRLRTTFLYGGKVHTLEAERLNQEEAESWRIRFSWDAKGLTFGDVTEGAGHVPLPPYIERNDEVSDTVNYQTVYSKIKGSVAAPTAGLHFSADVLGRLSAKGIVTDEITLHVGAGTFQPVKKENALEHEMHSEHFYIRRETIGLLKKHYGKIIPVGTTSVRTLESIYHIAARLFIDVNVKKKMHLGQWDAYNLTREIPVPEALDALSETMEKNNLSSVEASTGIMIVPGYRFMMSGGMITNFHQPRSTLLLLVSAFAGDRWKEIYRFAMENKFRFLSYGDSSLLLP